MDKKVVCRWLTAIAIICAITTFILGIIALTQYQDALDLLGGLVDEEASITFKLVFDEVILPTFTQVALAIAFGIIGSNIDDINDIDDKVCYDVPNKIKDMHKELSNDLKELKVDILSEIKNLNSNK